MICGVINRPLKNAFDMKTAFEKAARRAGMNIETAAYTMGLNNPTQLSQQLLNNGHLSWQRTLEIDAPEFWVSLLSDISDFKGVSLTVDSGNLRRDVMRLLVQLNRFSVSMLKQDTPVNERKRA